MILWGLACGALLGWGTGGFGSGVAGAILGAFLGFWLRSLIRKEMAERIDALRAELERSQALPQISPEEVAAVVPSPAAVPPATAERQTLPPLPVVQQAKASGTGELAGGGIPPRATREPSLVSRLLAAATGWLFGGNTIVRVGLVILFVGLSFLAHYAADAGLFPIELRLLMVAAVGIALLWIGFNRRLQKPEFALTLQGGGVAVLYLMVFAASRVFDAIPAAAAFPIMIVVCALGCALALLQNSQVLAATAFLGGFAVPVLLGGQGSALGLFGYYTVLNLAVLGLAWRRSWRIINLVGFVATFGIATAWGVLEYDPAQYWTCQFFLILFVLIYVRAGIFQSRNTPARLGNVVDSSLLFGPAIVGFGLQVGLVRDMPLGSALSALGFGALYLLLAVFVTQRGRGDNRLLADGLIAVAVGFVTLAIPLALGVRWTATVWALEGAGAFWLGGRQGRWLSRAFGLILLLAGGATFIGGLGDLESSLPVLNPATLGAMLIALPAFAIAWWLRRPLEHSGSRWAQGFASVEPALAKPAFLFGFAFWSLGVVLEFQRLLPPAIAGHMPTPAIAPDMIASLTMLALVVSAGLFAVVGRKTSWPVATWPSRVTLIALTLTLFAQWGTGFLVLETPRWIVWLVAVTLHYRLLWANDRGVESGYAPLQRATHIGSVWLMVALFLDCLWFGIDRADLWHTSWAGVALLVGPTAALLVLTVWAGDPKHRKRWPLRDHALDYLGIAALPIAASTFIGALIAALLASGQTEPLPYLPLLNPVDLAVGVAITALLLWRRTIVTLRPQPSGAMWQLGPRSLIALAALGFIAINTVWLRMAHHLLGVSWDPDALLDSFAVQTGLSILWTLLALVLTTMAHRRGLRTLWLTGGGLLAAVVLKLLLVDLSNANGGARIFTFIVVGMLMLVVGYFAPLPPRRAGTSPVQQASPQPRAAESHP